MEKSSVTWLAFVLAVAAGCSDPSSDAPTVAEPEERVEVRAEPVARAEPAAPAVAEAEPATPAVAEAEPASELPLAVLAMVPASAPRWAVGVARMCADGDPHGCWLLGAAYARDTLGPPDRLRAHALFAHACRREGGFGCAELASFETAEARAHLTRGCDAGRADACGGLARQLAPSDAAAATTARMRACSLGDAMLCLPVPEVFPHDASPAPAGAPTEESRIPAASPPTVRGAAQGCDRGMAAMCSWLSLQYGYDNDFGLPRDDAHSIELARRSCNDQALAGCTQLGTMLLMNARSAEDASASANALRRACAAGVAEACASNAMVVSRLPQMAPLAAMMRFEACVLGDQESCEPG